MGGGKAKKERQLALTINSDFARKAETAARIGHAIDDRFRVQNSGTSSASPTPSGPSTSRCASPTSTATIIPRFLEVVYRIPFEAGTAERRSSGSGSAPRTSSTRPSASRQPSGWKPSAQRRETF